MKIAELIHNTNVSIISGYSEITICDMTEDSRAVVAGCLFVARKGENSDGRDFIPDAIKKGAVAILSDCDICDQPEDIAVLHASNLNETMPHIAERFFGEPSKHLKLTGITGTNGKTTTAYLVKHLLNYAGIKCGLLSTVEIDDGRITTRATLTTPPAIEISRALSKMVTNDCKVAVMEVSSHALIQGRVSGLNFALAAYTNLSGDHLDYHASMDTYCAAKAKLFSSLHSTATAIINVDDDYWRDMGENCSAKIIRCSTTGNSADCWASVLDFDSKGTNVNIEAMWGSMSVRLPLVGNHNVANALQAAAIAKTLGVDIDSITKGLLCVPSPPGRLELVSDDTSTISVIVDYAHSDAALENVLNAVRPIVPRGSNLWVVFGCGGDRDKTKRLRMASVACELADHIVITSDNPRTEDPLEIICDIETGIPDAKRENVCSNADRRVAIHFAITNAAEGDVVLIAGKGHEDYQILGKKKIDFDDRKVAREALTLRQGSAIPA